MRKNKVLTWVQMSGLLTMGLLTTTGLVTSLGMKNEPGIVANQLGYEQTNQTHHQARSNSNNLVTYEAQQQVLNKATVIAQADLNDGFVSYDQVAQTVSVHNFYGGLSWTYDLAKSPFLATDQTNRHHHQVAHFDVLPIKSANLVAIYGTYVANSDNNPQMVGFYFALNASDGSSYLIDQNPNLSSFEQHQKSLLTSQTNALPQFPNQAYLGTNQNVNLLSTNKIQEYGANGKQITVINPITLGTNPVHFTANQISSNWTSFTTHTIIGFAPIHNNMHVLLLKQEDASHGNAYAVVAVDQFFTPYFQFDMNMLNSAVAAQWSNLQQFDWQKDLVQKAFVHHHSNTYNLFWPVLGDNAFVITAQLKNANDIASTQLQATQSLQFDTHKNWFDATYDPNHNRIFFAASNSNQHQLGYLDVSKVMLTNSEQPVAAALTANDATNGNNMAFAMLSNVSVNQPFFLQTFTAPVINTPTGATADADEGQSEEQMVTDSLLFGIGLDGKQIGITVNQMAAKAQMTNLTAPNPIAVDQALTMQQFALNRLPTAVNKEEVSKLIVLPEPYKVNENFKIQTGAFQQNNLTGEVSLNYDLQLKQWWKQNAMLNNPQDLYTIASQITVNKLQRVADRRFSVVNSSSVNPTKFSQLVNIVQNRFAETITKKEILDIFLEAGEALNITENDIMLTVVDQMGFDEQNNNTQNMGNGHQINVLVDQFAGRLQITYEIKANQEFSRDSGLTMLDYTNKEQPAVFNFVKNLNGYAPIVFANDAFNLLKINNFPATVTVANLISIIQNGNQLSYGLAENRWALNPVNPVGSVAWIEEQIDGILHANLQYLPNADDPTNENITKNFTTLIAPNNVINSGGGFLSIKRYITTNGDQTNFLTFRQQELETALLNNNITAANLQAYLQQTLANFVSFPNNWINLNQFAWSVQQNPDNPNLWTVTLQLQDDAQTNIQFNNRMVVFNQNWKTALLNKFASLYEPIGFTFTLFQPTVQWSATILESNEDAANQTALSIHYEQIADQLTNSYNFRLPSDFVADFANDPTAFQTQTQLLKIPLASSGRQSASTTVLQNSSSTNPNQDTFLNQYELNNINLRADNDAGNVIVTYSLRYPNLNNFSQVVTVTISGFLTNTQYYGFWIGIILLIALIVVVISIVVYVLFKNHRKKQVWSHRNFYKNFKKRQR